MKLESIEGSTEVVFGANKMLNLPGFQSTGAISYKLDTNNLELVNDTNSNWTDHSGTLSISDCSKSISIDLDFETKQSMRNSIRKLRIIKEIVAEAEVDLKLARKIYLKSDRIYKDIQEKKKKNEAT